MAIRQYSERTKQLLNDLDDHAVRSRRALLLLFVLATLAVAVNVNEKAGFGNVSRGDVRFLNRSEEISIDCGDSCSREERIHNLIIEREAKEQDYLTRLQLLELETVSLPLFGLKVSASVAGLVGVLGGMFLYVWLLLSVSKEKTALAHLFYPLAARESDPFREYRWKAGIDFERARSEAREIREFVSMSFLILRPVKENGSRRRIGRVAFIVLLPAYLLLVHTTLDVGWDFLKPWPAAGGRTLYEEFRHYAESLFSDSVQSGCVYANDPRPRYKLSYFSPPPCGMSSGVRGFKSFMYAKRALQASVDTVLLRSAQVVLALVLLWIAYRAKDALEAAERFMTLSNQEQSQALRAAIEDSLDLPPKQAFGPAP